MNGALRLGKAMWWMLARIKGWDGTTADVPPGRKIPAKYSLNQNYPNPFNPTTVITYQIPSESQVTLKVFNILGKEVATLVNEVQQPGNKMVKFDAAAFSNGVYFYRLEACQLSGGKSGPFTQTRKLVLLK
jgi:hypothetical protein